MRSNSIKRALLLAAGAGTRLLPLTRHVPKCMVPVGGRPIVDHLLENLQSLGIEEMVVVTGYKARTLEDHLRKWKDIDFRFVHNDRFDRTNNILSLQLAADVVSGPFMLLESDLFLERDALEALTLPDRALISRYTEGMDGTGLRLDASGQVEEMILAAHTTRRDELSELYKTVNCYSFSQETWERYAAALQRWIEAGRLDQYYEAVLAEIIEAGEVQLSGWDVSDALWGEVDTTEDLHEIERRM